MELSVLVGRAFAKEGDVVWSELRVSEAVPFDLRPALSTDSLRGCATHSGSLPCSSNYNLR